MSEKATVVVFQQIRCSDLNTGAAEAIVIWELLCK